MSPFSNYWRAVALALLPVFAFAVSYFAMVEDTRTEPLHGYNSSWIFGSVLLVGASSGAILYGMLDSAAWKTPKRRQVAWLGSILIGGTYGLLLLFVVLNTLGS